jgi:hypothetical protein
MSKTAIRVNKIDTLNWPDRCPRCGRDFQGDSAVGFELKIRKGLKGLLAGALGPKTVPVKLCRSCAKKISNFRVIEGIGGFIMFIAIFGPILIKKLKIQSAESVYIVGAAFWLGVVLMAIAEVGIRKGIGVECRLVSTDKWAFKFHDNLFSNEFVGLNSRYVERV